MLPFAPIIWWPQRRWPRFRPIGMQEDQKLVRVGTPCWVTSVPMFELSKVPTEVAKLLLCRGSDTFTLLWPESQNLLGKKVLEQGNDSLLFGGLGIHDLKMACAVRALLYLYTGWPVEAERCAAQAAPSEHAYIAGLCARHQTQSDAAKEWFQKLGKYALLGPLGERASQLLRSESDPPLKQYREAIEKDRLWKPFAFIDLFDQARTGKLSPTGERLVGRLQDLEFEMLFSHCFAVATGQNIAGRRVLSEAEDERRQQEYRRRMAQRRERIERTRKRVESQKTAQKVEKKTETQLPPREPKVKVLCPKCGVLVFVAESLRGKPARCIKCNSLFLVPHRQSEVPANTKSAYPVVPR